MCIFVVILCYNIARATLAGAVRLLVFSMGDIIRRIARELTVGQRRESARRQHVSCVPTSAFRSLRDGVHSLSVAIYSTVNVSM